MSDAAGAEKVPCLWVGVGAVERCLRVSFAARVGAVFPPHPILVPSARGGRTHVTCPHAVSFSQREPTCVLRIPPGPVQPHRGLVTAAQTLNGSRAWSVAS